MDDTKLQCPEYYSVRIVPYDVGDKISLTIEEIKRDIYSNFRFEIKDTGFGMTKEFLERVFLPFERETRKKEMKEEIIEEKN